MLKQYFFKNAVTLSLTQNEAVNSKELVSDVKRFFLYGGKGGGWEEFIFRPFNSVKCVTDLKANLSAHREQLLLFMTECLESVTRDEMKWSLRRRAVH